MQLDPRIRILFSHFSKQLSTYKDLKETKGIKELIQIIDIILDPKKGLSEAQKAINQLEILETQTDHPSVSYFLGLCYHFGIGISIDSVISGHSISSDDEEEDADYDENERECKEKGEDADSAKEDAEVAAILKEEIFKEELERRVIRARKFFDKTADDKHASAHESLGIFFISGRCLIPKRAEDVHRTLYMCGGA